MSDFPKFSGFCDLNVGPHNELLSPLVDLNYRVVAMNQNFADTVFKEKKGVPDPVPHPHEIQVSKYIKRNLQILNRLTIEILDLSSLQKLEKSDNLKKYHLIALSTNSEAVFQQACTSKLVDIISFNRGSHTSSFRLTRKLYNIAVNQNIYFEVPYAPCIETPKRRLDIINAAHSYHAIGKSKNIIVTSDAKRRCQLRSPYEVIALGRILGLSEEKAKNAITHNCKNLLLRAEGRRFGRVVMTLTIRDNTKELQYAKERKSDVDDTAKVKDQYGVEYNSVCEDKSYTDNVPKIKNSYDMECGSASEDRNNTDDAPKAKRHCADPLLKTFLMNKDLER